MMTKRLTTTLLALIALVATGCGGRAAPSLTNRILSLFEPTPTPVAPPSVQPRGEVVTRPWEEPQPFARMVSVRSANGSGAFLAQSPGTAASIRPLSEGTMLFVVGPTLTVDGQQWASVRDPDGNRGWVPESTISPLTLGTDAPSPTSETTGPSKRSATAIDFGGTFTPSVVRAGDRLTIAIDITNRGDETIHGLVIRTTGPWAAFTVLAVRPDGSLIEGQPSIYELRSAVEIGPAETGHITIETIPQQPGIYTFAFVPYELDGSELDSGDGTSPTSGGTVTVYR